MIDAHIKSRLGQMIKGVQVVAATHGGLTRAYCSHWVCQVSFDEPIVMASVSPRHDTYPLLRDAGWFSVSILAADQVAEGQYFSYPGRRFRHIAEEYISTIDGVPVVPGCIAWLRCETFAVEERVGDVDLDHHLVFARVTAAGDTGRLKDPPLLYSSRLGWRVTGERAREPGRSIRDELLDRLDRLGAGGAAGDDGADARGPDPAER